MRDKTYENYLIEAERIDLISSIDFLESEYGAEFKFDFEMYVGAKLYDAVGSVQITKGFELDGIAPANQYGDAYFHGDAIIQEDMSRYAWIRIAHYTNGVTHLSEVTETIVRKIFGDIPSVKTRIRMMFQISGRHVPWYLK